MEQELEHPLRPLGERLVGLEVEEADQVDGEEGEEEERRDRRAPGEPAVAGAEAVAGEGDQEDPGEDVGEAERARDLPLQLRERDREDGREEERVDDGAGPASWSQRADELRELLGARAAREAVARLLRDVGPGQAAVREPLVQLGERRTSSASTSSGGATTPAPVSRIRSAAAPSGGTAREDRPLGGEVLEDLARRERPCRARPRPGSGAAAPPSRAGARATPGAARTGSAPAGRRARALPPTRGRRSGSRRGSAPARRAPTRRARSGTDAGRACRRSCRCA